MCPVENAIKTVKRLMKMAREDNHDLFLALLQRCNVPSEHMKLPLAQMITTWSILHVVEVLLIPEIATVIFRRLDAANIKQKFVMIVVIGMLKNDLLLQLSKLWGLKITSIQESGIEKRLWPSCQITHTMYIWKIAPCTQGYMTSRVGNKRNTNYAPW